MSQTAADLTLTADPAGGGRSKITVTTGGAVVFVDALNPSAAAARGRFVAAVAAKLPGIDRERIDAELMRLAAAGGSPPARDDQLQEVDARRVVRPELFHTPEASGITVGVALDCGGKLVPRWRTHLRWADGRREAIDMTDRITTPAGPSLLVHPDPGEPPVAEPPAWSAESRRAWLDGCPAPPPAAVFNAVFGRFEHYLDFPADAGIGTTATLSLWAILTYLYPAWDAVPYLSVGGPMGSGKSRVLDVLARLVFRPIASANLTAPALFRTLHAYGGTMLYDEAERLKQSDPSVEETRSIFLAGYKRGGCATRLEPVGDSFRPVRFDVYGQKALACIAGLPPTLASRCIPVTMLRSAAASEKPKRRIDADRAAWQSVRDDLHALALEHGPLWGELADRADVVPAGISGRNFELWQPLLALALWFEGAGVGGLYDAVAVHAQASVTGAKDDAVPEADEVLLSVLAEAVRQGDCPTNGELLSAAKSQDEITFKSWGPKGVGGRLKTYGIPQPTKIGGERRHREVTVAHLREIETRYGIDLGLSDGRE